ncbi:MAG: hypothetical protein JSV42_14220 [Chloroflexota bacterium]|nr:MAG: hypothetical protein JSV42_14220 [Chloroflexota bacterium]
MTLIEILQIAVAIATILTGVISLFWPLKVRGFTGLEVEGGRGITEIRAVLGGFFVGLGAAVLFINEPAAYLTLGIAYLVVAAIRTISMFVDKSVVQSNVISVITEVIFGVILVF